MRKSIILALALVFSVCFVSGCTGKTVAPDEDVSFFRGFLPSESWTDFKKRIEAKENYPEPVQETQVSEKSSGIQVKKTYIPSNGIKGSVSLNGKGVGMEVYDDDDYYEDRTVIKLFSGSRGPDYSAGQRNEKRNARQLKDDLNYQRAISLAEKHAKEGYMSHIGVPGKYYKHYEEAYEHYVNSTKRQDFNDYRRSQYEQGVEDYRAKNPEYGNFAQLTEQLEVKARADAQASRYQLPAGLSPELERVYYEVFVSEVRSLIKEKARRDAKTEIFDPPYNMPDFIGYYEKIYTKELYRHSRKGDRRRW